MGVRVGYVNDVYMYQMIIDFALSETGIGPENTAEW
jgi:hypothetical protein